MPPPPAYPITCAQTTPSHQEPDFLLPKDLSAPFCALTTIAESRPAVQGLSESWRWGVGWGGG